MSSVSQSWRARHARGQLTALTAELERQARDSLSPFVDSIAAAAADIATWTAPLQGLTQLQDARQRVSRQYEEIDRLVPPQRR